MKAEIESEMVWNAKTWEIFLADVIVEINVFFAALVKLNVIFLHDLKMQ